MRTLAVWLALCGCAFGTDERLGFATAFHNWAGSDPEYNLSFIPGNIAAETPAMYVRSDVGWVDGEQSPGVYINGSGVRTQDQQWIDACAAKGLKIVLVFNQYYTPSFYPTPSGWLADSSGTSPAARFAAQVAKFEEARLGAGNFVLEVFNEPNNSKTLFGANWPANCVQATRLIADAVHAVSHVRVIGLGAQGNDILTMLGMQTDVDGVVYHADNGGPDSPFFIWQNTALGNNQSYIQWISMVQKAAQSALTQKMIQNADIWVTEAAQNGGSTEYESAIWVAGHLWIDAFYGISHTFLYQYIGHDPGQSTLDYYRSPRMNRAVINMIYSLLSADPWRPGYPLVPDSNPIVVSSIDPSFDSTKFAGFDFQIPGYRGASPPTSMAVVMITGDPILDETTHPVQITVYHPMAGTILATDNITGRQWHLYAGKDWYQSGNNVVITNAEVGVRPVTYKIWNGAVTVP